MSQRTMILSAFLAALVLVVIGGAVAYVTQPAAPELAQAAPPEATPAEAAPEPPAAADPAEGRDADYRRLIAEANRRLTEQQRALDEARRRARRAEARSAPVRPVAPSGWRGGDDDDHERYEHGDDDDHERYEHHPRRGERWEHDDD